MVGQGAIKFDPLISLIVESQSLNNIFFSYFRSTDQHLESIQDETDDKDSRYWKRKQPNRRDSFPAKSFPESEVDLCYHCIFSCLQILHFDCFH